MKDRWGIPVLRFHWEWSDHELNQVRHMQQTFRAILDGRQCGGQVGAPAAGRGRSGAAGADGSDRREVDRPPISRGGAIIHEVGTVRMGDDPKTSALNKYLPGARREEPVRRRRARRSSATPTRTPRTRSSRSRGARPNISQRK